MGRCKKERCCRFLDSERIFKPIGIPMGHLMVLQLELDEFEALRLCDLESKNQIQASEILAVSRGTIQRLLYSGRKKIVSALLNNYSIKIKNLEEQHENLPTYNGK